MRTISEMASLAGVTVRTLHHYDTIGLLRPSGRSDAGYRLYSPEDMERLQEILGWRRLGFSLARIGELMDEPDHCHAAALEAQRRLVREQRRRLNETERALDRALAAHHDGTRQSEDTMFEGFDPSEYEQETRDRWGETDAYAESKRCTASYGETEWQAIKEESEEISCGLGSLYEAGTDASSEQAMALAERHRDHISRWFYACSPEMHRGLGEMYVADARFARNWNERSDGLADYVRAAIVANSARASLHRPDQ